jgi:hypothetical protein
MVIARAAAMIADRADDGKVMGLAREMRQMLAERDAWGAGGAGPKRTAVFGDGIGLHVPGVDVRRPAAEPDHDRRLRRSALCGRGRIGRRMRQIQPEEAEPACDEKCPSIDGNVATRGTVHETLPGPATLYPTVCQNIRRAARVYCLRTRDYTRWRCHPRGCDRNGQLRTSPALSSPPSLLLPFHDGARLYYHVARRIVFDTFRRAPVQATDCRNGISAIQDYSNVAAARESNLTRFFGNSQIVRF